MTKSTGIRDARRTETVEAAFLRRLVRRGPDECWPWVGTRTKHGYGKFGHHYEEHYAHRLAHEVFNGPAGELLVLHSCDNPPCCNPAHLRLGTHQENMREAVERGRMSCEVRIEGTDHPLAKLDEQAVRIIRASNDKGTILAKRYGVAESLISRIRLRQSWKHVA